MGLDTVELVLAVEEEFGIEIPNAMAAQLIAVGDLYDCVVGQLRSRNEPLAENEVWERLRSLIVDHLGVRPDEITRSAEFVRDLKAD